MGGVVILKVVGEESAGRLTAFETIVAPGQGPPVHVHANEDETLYVVDGVVRFKLGDELHTGGAGALAFVPRGTEHTFQNVGDDEARMLIHFSPSGVEHFFVDFAALSAPDAGDFARLGAEQGMTVVGPPLAQA